MILAVVGDQALRPQYFLNRLYVKKMLSAPITTCSRNNVSRPKKLKVN